MADDVIPLAEQFDSLERRLGSWGAYKEHFAALDEQARTVELSIFDRAFGEERAIPSREFATHWNRRRELAGLDSLLRRAGR
jgi:hypothetical protein